MTEEQPMLPGFEFMADDVKKHEQDKALKKEILEATRDYTALKDSYSSPFKLIEAENRLRKAIKARNELWGIKENDGG